MQMSIKAHMRLLPALLLILAQMAHAAGAADSSDRPEAFYTWEGRHLAPAGTVLRSQPLPIELSVPDAGTSLRLLYVSTSGIDGKTPVAVSGVLFLPKGTAPRRGWPLVSWAHGTTGISDLCAPSRIARSARDSDYLRAWLKAGYAVAASDYEGLGTSGIHPYSNYRAAAYSVLDIARAVARKWPVAKHGAVIVGQSQGAAAAVAAGGYAPRYAPELRVGGIVATGLPNLSRQAILSGLAWSATDTMVTGAYAMIGYELSRIHPDFLATDIFTEQGLALYNLVPNTCLGGLMQSASKDGLDPGRTFKPGMLARLWNTDVDLRSFPTLRLSMPLFVGIGLADTAALPESTMRLVDEMCRAGSEVRVEKYEGQDHNGVVPAATVDAIRFAKHASARLSNKSFKGIAWSESGANFQMPMSCSAR